MSLIPRPSVLVPPKAVFFLHYSSPSIPTTSSHQYVKLLKFADDSTLIGHVSEGDESVYRWEIGHLVTWCNQNNLELHTVKTVKMVEDFRKNPVPPAPIILCDSPVDIVDSFCFLGTIITQDLKWEMNMISLILKISAGNVIGYNLPPLPVHFQDPETGS